METSFTLSRGRSRFQNKPISVPLVPFAVGEYPFAYSNAGTANYTYVLLDHPATADGFIYIVRMFFKTNATGVKIGTFSRSGADFTLHDQYSIGSISSGFQTAPVKLKIKLDNYIGIYYASGGMAFNAALAAGLYYKAGDQFDAGTQTYTILAGYNHALEGLGIS